jgi:hypothetical protein
MLFISCKNNDVVIQKSDFGCDVSNPNGYYIRLEGIDETRGVELKNKSETKVYKVVVKIINKGKVNFKEYVIEPTDLIKLGCDKDFDITVIGNYDDPNAMRYTSNISKYNIIYKIDSVELVRED